jgi:sigma-B regulation protein RsbU (phosphoserine phosphatase)
MLNGQPRPGADGVPGRSVGELLLRTLPGRALVVGAIIRLAAWAAQLVVGRTPLLEAVGVVGTLALLAGIGVLSYRLIRLAKRRLLWRVRRKLILSYIFVGLVPALLIIVFFALCGWLLFSSVSSYVVQTRLRGMVDQAHFLARTTAVELSRANPDTLEERLARKQETIESRFPEASMAIVPTSRKCASDLPGAKSIVVSAPAASGPWPHVLPPEALPDWIGCSGFSGLMAYWIGSPDALAAAMSRRAAGTTGLAGSEATPNGETRLFVRAVAMPDGASPGYAVVLDLPLNELAATRLKEETGIEPGAIALSGGGPAPILARPGSVPSRAAEAGAQRFQPAWVVFLDYTDWDTGRIGTATIRIMMSVGQIYDRLAPSKVGPVTFGQMLVLLIMAVGILFLVIQFVALVMGLALARSITGSVHELFIGTERVRQGDFSHQIEVRAQDQLGELADSFNSMTGRLGQLLTEMAEKKRLEEELRIARDIQMSLLPERVPMQIPGVSVTALCHPAREVGGDYYDFLPLDANRLGLLIADVSGKGTSAALYMAEMKGLMLSLSQIHTSPRELLIAANRIISDNLDSRSFITMTYAIVDLKQRTMTWARAGHTPLIHLPAGGGERRRAEIIVTDGMVLGLKLDNGERFESLLEEVTTPLVPGDLFMFFTDGLSEQMNPGEELFGESRLGEIIEEHGDLPFDELRERIVREVRAFAGAAAQHDDMTFILLRIDNLGVSGPAPDASASELLVSTS